MKKTIALSVLLGAMSASIFSAAPSFAQTVTVPIIGGTLNTVNKPLPPPPFPSGIGESINSLTSSTFLTPLGTVFINRDGFNGTLNNIPVTSSVLSTEIPVYYNFNFVPSVKTFAFTGTTNGIGPTGIFNNAPTTINASPPNGLLIPMHKDDGFAIDITGGSITLPSISSLTVPIISGTLNTVSEPLPEPWRLTFPAPFGAIRTYFLLRQGGYITSLTSSTFLTPLGTVNINSDGFNGNLTLIHWGSFESTATVTSSILSTKIPVNTGFGGSFSFVFAGTTNGISPTGIFNNAPTNFFANLTSLYPDKINISGGSITFPSSGSLAVTPYLLLSNNVLQGAPVNNSDYIYSKEDFSKTSFQSRILYMEDK